MTASDTLTPVELWTDGACAGNPGPGGWATVLRMGAHERELAGGEVSSTNNKMELTAVLEGLRALSRPCHVTIHLDSSYVMFGFTKNWVRGWKANGWKTSAKQPVKNQDLWEQLDIEVARHTVEWVLVKGHNGIALNERVDELAVAQRDLHSRLA
jgi:ribonuclease HI